jgi:hypothetical protein
MIFNLRNYQSITWAETLYLQTQMKKMKLIAALLCLVFWGIDAMAQKMTIEQMKTELEKSTNSPLYAKDVLKKRFKIDTISISRIGTYQSLADSLGYAGKLKKVYGPFGKSGSRFLVQVLAKAPINFYHISQIYIDTSVFRYRFADSLGNTIIRKINTGKDTFEHLAQTYSMGGETLTQGDLGWVAPGMLIPEIRREVVKRKKGDIFKVWSKNGLHIIKNTDDPKQDTGYSLMMRVFL